MKEAQFFRKDHVIKDANGKVVFTGIVKIGGKEFASINKAKASVEVLPATLGHCVP